MRREIIFYIIAAIVFTICVGGLFSLKSEGKGSYFPEDLKVKEEQYIKEVKDVLSEYYMGKSGITLTKVSGNATNIEYTAQIHTGYDNSMEMIRRIKALSIDVPGSSIKVVFN